MGARITPALRTLLDKKTIRRSTISSEMVVKELDGARRDLETARKSLKRRDDKWATIQAYYSIFHAGRALLFAKGFRERSHRGLLAALRLLYSGRDTGSMLEDFSEAMSLREQADYGLVYSEQSAHIAIEDAENFLRESSKLLVLSATRVKRLAPRRRKSRKR